MGLFIVRCERGLVIVARRYEVKNILCVRCQKLNKFAVKATNSPRCQYSFLSLLKRIFFLAVKKKIFSLSKRIPSLLKYFCCQKNSPRCQKKKLLPCHKTSPRCQNRLPRGYNIFFAAVKIKIKLRRLLFDNNSRLWNM